MSVWLSRTGNPTSRTKAGLWFLWPEDCLDCKGGREAIWNNPNVLF